MQTHDSSAPRLLSLVRDRIRRKHYSIRTEQAYLHWVKAFVRFHGMKHPADMGAPELESFLTYLSVERHVSSSTQNQALSGLLFLYREVLEIELPWLDGIERSKRPKRMPVVLTQDEVTAVLGQLDGTTALILKLAYGTGMRIMEVVRLRVKDVEFTRGELFGDRPRFLACYGQLDVVGLRVAAHFPDRFSHCDAYTFILRHDDAGVFSASFTSLCHFFS